MDNQTLIIIAVVAGFVIFFGGFIWLVIHWKRNIRKAWEGFAKAHGFELRMSAYPGTKGEIDGRMVEVNSMIGKSPSGRPDPRRVAEFQIKVGLKGAVPAKLVAGRRGMLQGRGSVQTGDAEFDKKIWVDGADPQAAVTYLSPDRKDALREVAKLGAVVLGANEDNPAMLAHTRMGYKPKFEWLEALLQEFLTLAARLDGD